MKVSVEIKDKDIIDAIVTALEGGSNHWYNLPDTSMVLKVKGVSLSERIGLTVFDDHEAEIPVNDLELVDEEDEDADLGVISYKNIQRGLDLFLVDHFFDPAMDAEDADTFLQLVVMGEVEFG